MITDVSQQSEPAAAPANPLVELRGIDVRFGGVHAIDDVSMSMGADEIVGLIGPNGAGKSTLVGVVAGTVRPGSGSVRLLGSEVSGRPARKRSALGLARTFQHPAVFATLTVRENLEFGRSLRRTAGRRLTAEQAAFCEDAVDRLDVARWLDWRAGAVPHPVQRMVETARAVLTAAPLMLVDEPAAGLNDTARENLVHVLQDYRSRLGAGILLVEHDVPLVLATCTRIVVLHEGRLLADATPEEIRNDPQVIDAYFGAPL